MNKIKTDFDAPTIKLVAEVMVAILWRPLPGLDLERLVLQEWWYRVSCKFGWIDGMGGHSSFRVALRPSEALALHRILQVVPLPEEWDVDRQALTAQIEPKLIPFQSERGATKLLK
jgi:hypothetical protein